MSIAFTTSITTFSRWRTRIFPQLTRNVNYRSISRQSHTKMKIDSHVHVWDAAFPTHPDHPLPPIVGTANDLISKMDEAGIEKTIIVQPINYKFDNSCIKDAKKKFPNRFVLVALVDTTLSPENARDNLQKLVKEDSVSGIRINPNFTPDGFNNTTVFEYVREAAKLNIPVALFARPEHLTDVAKLVSSCPDTNIVLDHFAFCSPEEKEADQERVAKMGQKYPNLYVKTSAWFRVSKQGWPHSDLTPYLRSLLDNFGAERLLIGSDYPFVTEQYDYKQAFLLLDQADISSEERKWIEGESAKKLYKL